ncbi:hypothetical protein CRYUN_Cryun30bG0011100 [Craigia yunnanensis]
MQQGDFSSYYQYPHLSNPNPNTNQSPIPTEFQKQPYASAPPFTSGYASSEYSVYPPNYTPYSENPDPVPPTAPSYAPPPSVTTTPPTPTLTLQSSFNHQSVAPSSAAAASFFPPYDSHVPYQPPTSQPPYYQPYDQHQTAPSYGPPPPNSNHNPNPPYYSAPYGQIGSSVSFVPPAYDNPYDNSMKIDHSGSSYFDDKFGAGYNRSRSDMGSDLYGKRLDSYSRFGDDDGYSDGVYAYEGGKVEPYGARGKASKSSTWVQFDDYGRSINFPSGKDSSGGSGSALIGLDGIRMLDPSTSRTLRIYPLENITRCEVSDRLIYLSIWSKSSVDIEPRRIRLQSNSYTTNTLLDIITAATVQIKEMDGRIRPPESLKTTEKSAEKKGFTDWMSLTKSGIEEKDHWVPDEAVSKCTACGTDFGAFVRRHHCRNCGDNFCDKCTHGRIALTADENAQPVRVCDRCMAEVTQRLSNAKEADIKPVGLQSHEDLAKRLQEEMEKNRRALSGNFFCPECCIITVK